MKNAQFKLSVEELAYSMGVLGGADVASGFLLALLGQQPARSIENRLLAASHSLVARELLDFDLNDGSKTLAPSFHDMVDIFVRHDFSLRCGRVARGNEETLNYYVRDGNIIEHRLQQHVVSCLTIVNRGAMAKRAAQFFHLREDKSLDIEEIGLVPAELLDAIRSDDRATAESVVASLTDAGITKQHARTLAEDLLYPVSRGSVNRIEIRDEQAVSDQGFLLLEGSQRLWIMDIVPTDAPLLKIKRGHSRLFSTSLEALLGK